jgi:hypothetical protein
VPTREVSHASQLSPKAILQAIEHLKVICEDEEWWEDRFPLDPENLYRHVGALLAGSNSPEPEAIPAKITEVSVKDLLSICAAEITTGHNVGGGHSNCGSVGRYSLPRLLWGRPDYRLRGRLPGARNRSARLVGDAAH